MITAETLQLTKKYRSRKIKENNSLHSFEKKDSKKLSLPVFSISTLISIAYGLCYGFLTYTLLNFSYDLFLHSVIKTVFFISMPSWALIVPAVITGFVYFLIAQTDLYSLIYDYFIDKSNIKQNDQSWFLFSIGILVSVFISIEFFQFLAFSLPTALTIAVLGALSHFGVFYKNASESLESLSKLFESVPNHINSSDRTFVILYLLCPVLAVFNVIFITGLFHPIVIMFFSLGIISFSLKKWREYKSLDVIRRLYATLDSLIREYAALIIHCIGEGAIPAAAATHTTRTFSKVSAQLSGLVATTNEYFCDFHAISGDSHSFNTHNITKNLYLCEVYDDDALDIDKCFYFTTDEIQDEIKIAQMHLHDQFNGVFMYDLSIELSDVNLKKYQLNPKSEELDTYLDALLGIKFRSLFNKNLYLFYLVTLIFLTACISLTVLPFFNLLPVVFSIPILLSTFLLYRNILKFLNPNALFTSDEDNNMNFYSEEEPEHSHGLEYKPFIKRYFGLSSYVNLQDRYLTLIHISLILISFAFISSYCATFSLVHKYLLFPAVLCIFTACFNFGAWLFMTDKAQKCHDMNNVINSLENPTNWFKGIAFLAVSLVAMCIGINGGAEFVKHLSFMFATSTSVMPIIIGVFIVCALLTEGVWINQRLTKACSPLSSLFLSNKKNVANPSLNENLNDDYNNVPEVPSKK